ncbi:MAG: hypothetical protein JEZ14_20455 [Marinilabiliaceae bacterium]|nr:hypothetical protein [Marinilabiliaceae bacterium]
MKKFRFLFSALALVATLGFVSCSNDDDPQPKRPEVIQPLPPTAEQPLPENPEITPH